MRKWEGSGKDIDLVPETDEIVAENSVIQANGKGIVPMETDTQNESSSLVDTGPSYSLDEIRAMNLGAIEKLLETNRKLSETLKQKEEEVFKSDWRKNNLNFDSHSKLVQAVKAVTREDIIKLYHELLAQEHFGRVMVQMRGTNFKDQAFVEHKDAKQITDVNDFHQAQLK